MRQLTIKAQEFAKRCFITLFWLLLLVPPIHSPAQEASRWTTSLEPNSAWLAYGQPEIAEFEISFQCEAGSPNISGNFYFTHAKSRPGQAVAVSLTGGDVELVEDTTVKEDPNAGGWRVEFHYPLNKATESALRAKTPLKVKINSYKISKSFPRSGQDQAVAEFLDACSGFTQDSTRLSARGVPASFDCKKATRPVDQFICGHAALRWQDLALARSYRAALSITMDPKRVQTLKDDQRRWVKQRDQQCAGKSSLKTLQKDAGKIAYRCLLESYQKQRDGLTGVAPNWWARGVTQTTINDIALARPDWQAAEDHAIFDGSLSPDSLHLALLLPDDYGADTPGSNQVWLYHAGSTRGVAVTPNPSGRVPGAKDEVMRIATLAWDKDNTLYARAWLWGGKNEQHAQATFAATPRDRAGRRITETPAIKALLDKAEREKDVKLDALPADEQDAVVAAWGNAKHLVWVADRAHGTMELLTQENKPGAQPYLISWGGWELAQSVFDAYNGRLLYPSEFGLKLYELNSRLEWDIIGAEPQARPLGMIPRRAGVPSEVEGSRITWIQPILPRENAPTGHPEYDQTFKILNATLLPMPEDSD